MNALRSTKQDIRRAIISAALDIAATDGWSGVTVRKIAEQVGYTPPIIYEYFANKNAMLWAIAEEGYKALLTDLQRIPKEDPDFMVALAEGYWNFAHQNPAIYQLMFSKKEVLRSADYYPGQDLVEFVKTLINDALPVRLGEQEIEDLFVSIWVVLHGLVVLSANDMLLDCGPRQATRILKTTVQDIVSAHINRDNKAGK